NNQVGFTTSPEEGRSSTYSTDVAKMVQAPILHVNGDDPEAAYDALQIALDYRQRFRKDIVIDVVGFRRHGHNEGDEPTYTQPVMYRLIRAHPGIRQLYAERLTREGAIGEEEVAALIDKRMRRYEDARLGAIEIVKSQQETPIDIRDPVERVHNGSPVAGQTAVDHSVLRRIAAAVTSVPRGFVLNPKITGLLARRARMVEGEQPVDWGMAEALALGSLVLEGKPVRLTGQDTQRGTFSQRHATLHDNQTGEPWTPLSGLDPNQSSFEVFDSPLSEAGALGFEYGYSVAAPEALVLWEAQFGDFINAAQVIVDQFIVAGHEKWNQPNSLVLLLPHGYEGQGPEHSSARLERFLALGAGDNLRVVMCSTAAQYFHLLRTQGKLESPVPLVVATPKSLLRSTGASSPIATFTNGGFRAVLGDPEANSSRTRRVLLCSGKIYYDLVAEREKRRDASTAIARVEQLYPFPLAEVTGEIGRSSGAAVVRWVQEEPENQGAWRFVRSQLRSSDIRGALEYCGRPASPSTATGSHTVHQIEQQRLLDAAFSGGE
ncbi:MAG TPA: thiamine pyrophosphate-dependent enzyme, partial [Blastocatellia bacterium]|nr:thiamine pyrophosphate-dependent enzyme [Blastocatellia bacterium]